MKPFEVGDVIIGMECSYLIISILFGGTYVCFVSTGKIEHRTASFLNRIQERKINSTSYKKLVVLGKRLF